VCGKKKLKAVADYIVPVPNLPQNGEYQGLLSSIDLRN